MEVRLYNNFWTKHVTDFTDLILDSSYKVLLKKVKVATIQQPVKFLTVVTYNSR